MAQTLYFSAAWDAFSNMGYRWKLPVVTVCSFCIYSIYNRITVYLSNSRLKKEHGCLPPKRIPQFERILGLGLILQNSRHYKAKTVLEQIHELHTTLGRTWTAAVFGTTFVMTTDPENIKAILATQFEDFGLFGRLEVLGPLLGKGIFIVDGAAWQHSRALIRPAFTKTQVADLDSFESHLQKLIAKVPTDGSTVNLAPLFFRLTLDVATDFLFGESVNSLESEEGSKQQQFGAAFDYAQNNLGSPDTFGWQRHVFYFSKFSRSCRFVHSFIDEFVAKAQKEQQIKSQVDKSATDADADDDNDNDNEKHPKRYVFLHELSKATNDPIQIRDESLSIMMAGRDTTANLLTTTFHILSRRPDIWTKLQSSIAPLNNEASTYETLRNIKYLKYFINETLRLYPVVPANTRVASKNTTLPRGGGPKGTAPIFIQKGQPIQYAVWSMHRDKSIYGDDAEEFKPERWENLRTGWDYLPFNGGPRICIGQQFALTEVSYTIVRLLQHFSEIESRDSNPWQEALSLTVTNVHGAKVALTPA
ncbi:MAG: hypothetical protein M1812_000977 [Candelaria pacifica]|nr:MAG: hypothetical protein M1812_000977 [Candelaria pacifica]